MQVYYCEEGKWKGLKVKTHDPKESAAHQIIRALDLTTLKLNDILTEDFLRFNPTMSESPMSPTSVILGLAADHWMIRVSKGFLAQVDPIELDSTCSPLVGNFFFILYVT